MPPPALPGPDSVKVLSRSFPTPIASRILFETAKRLLASAQVSDGFRWLWEHQLLRLSVENAVLAPGFEELFTDHERAVAEQRLRDAGVR